MVLSNPMAFPPSSTVQSLEHSVQVLLNVDPWYDLLLSVSVTVDSAINRLIHSVEVAHCTHTTEPMASYSHSGGPTTFRINHSIAMTLSRPLQLNPHRLVLGGPVSTKDTTTTVVANVPHGDYPSWGPVPKSQQRAHKVMSAYRARVPHAHNLP